MCVFCVLFFFFFFFFLRPNLSPPCLLCPMSPALPGRGGGGGVVGAEASRYLYRPNSWGPPRQSREGWVGEKRNKDHRNFRLNQALEMSLCCLFVFLAIFLRRFVLLPWVSLSGHVRSVGRPDDQTILAYKHLVFDLLLTPSVLFLSFFLQHVLSCRRSGADPSSLRTEPTGRRKAELLLLI